MDQFDPDTTVTGQITRILAERIVAGTLSPGTRLRQDRIAEEFGASHVPVREAFRRLEAQGLAVSEPRRGVRVAALDPAAVREVSEMRAALEVLALRHAVPRTTRQVIIAAEAELAAAEASNEIAVWEPANRRFHRTIVAPCDMPRLLAAIDDLHVASSRFLFAIWRSYDAWQPRSDQEHRQLLAAIAAGKARAACKLLSDHITAAAAALVSRLETSARPASE